jgi:hypothetical protein
LVALNRCCPLCDQEDENVQHLLTSCVFSRQVWYSILSLVGLQQYTPGPDALSFIEWWHHAMQQIEKQHRKGFNSLVVLVAWWIWKHRNACVFEGTSSNVNALMQKIRDVANLWCMAGAKGLRRIWP